MIVMGRKDGVDIVKDVGIMGCGCYEGVSIMSGKQQEEKRENS